MNKTQKMITNQIAWLIRGVNQKDAGTVAERKLEGRKELILQKYFPERVEEMKANIRTIAEHAEQFYLAKTTFIYVENEDIFRDFETEITALVN